MKKLLLVTTALAGVAMMSAPASAAVKMDLGGFFRGYGVWADNDEPTGTPSLYTFEFRRNTELWASGETTLDNGLTIGAHTELRLANGADTTITDEIYGYASGGWGRFNLGDEDGAAYLLQVNAPSADSNIDGIRLGIQGLNPASTVDGFSTVGGAIGVFPALTAATYAFGNNGLVQYAHSDFASNTASRTDRLTYLTPKFNGFQAGASYAPRSGLPGSTAGMAVDDDGFGLFTDGGVIDSVADYQDLWEASARYDGEFEGFAFGIGAGYSDSTIEETPSAAAGDFDATDDLGGYYLNDGIRSWNGVLSIASQGFSLGGAYKFTETSRITDDDDTVAEDLVSGDITSETWVVGVGYDNGPWHAGASYLNTDTELDALIGGTGDNPIFATGREDTRYTVGGGYTFGPGMTFRGAVAWGDFDNTSTGAFPEDDNNFTQVTVGTDIKF